MLHTTDCGQVIYWILGLFDFTEEKQVRARLADSLKCVLSQRLMSQKDGKRVAAFELLLQSLRTQEIILHGESDEESFHDV